MLILASLLTVLLTLTAPPDTFHLPGGAVVRLEKISLATFEAAPVTPQLAAATGLDSVAVTRREARRLQAAPRVLRRGYTLTLQPQRGTTVKLVSAPFSHCNTTYLFAGSLSGIRHWLVETWVGCEAVVYLLIDQRTGQKSELIDYPVVSADRRHIACATNDLRGMFDNGLELWRFSARGTLQKQWFRATTDGIAAIRWADNQTMLLRMANGTRVSYRRLRLPAE